MWLQIVGCIFLVSLGYTQDSYNTINANENRNLNDNQVYNNLNSNFNPSLNYNPNPNYNNQNPNVNYGSSFDQSTNNNPNPPNYNPGLNYNLNTYGGQQGTYSFGNIEELKCPQHWIQFQNSCYRFIKSPLRAYSEARQICQTFTPETGGSDLVSIRNSDQHGFLIHQLDKLDPQHRRWYIGAHQSSPNYYTNPDGTQLVNMDNAFLENDSPYRNDVGKDYLAYNFSKSVLHWRFQPVRGDEPLLFICEANVAAVQRLVSEERGPTYGIDIVDPKKIPRGPYFIKQPNDATFDTSKRKLYNDISVREASEHPETKKILRIFVQKCY